MIGYMMASLQVRYIHKVRHLKPFILLSFLASGEGNSYKRRKLFVGTVCTFTASLLQLVFNFELDNPNSSGSTLENYSSNQSISYQVTSICRPAF